MPTGGGRRAENHAFLADWVAGDETHYRGAKEDGTEDRENGDRQTGCCGQTAGKLDGAGWQGGACIITGLARLDRRKEDAAGMQRAVGKTEGEAQAGRARQETLCCL